MNELDKLWVALERSPKDWVRYLVLADWYEEHGETKKATCLRWVSSENKQPFYDDDGWNWELSHGVGTQSASLPDELFDQLPMENRDYRTFRPYQKWRRALQALLEAWEQCEHPPSSGEGPA